MMQYKKISILATALICVTAGMISACVTPAKVMKPTHYTCDRGTNFSVTYTEKGITTVRGGRNSMPRYEIKNVAANITLVDGTLITLPIQKSGSGFMYSNGKHTFRGAGNEAMWSVGRMLAEHCKISS